MGQYFKAVVADDLSLDTIAAFASDSGNKLMETSYVGNGFPGAVMDAITGTPKRVAWVGDYSDHEKDAGNGAVANLDAKKYHGLYERAYDIAKRGHGEYEDFEAPRFLVNHTRKTFVDMAHRGRKADKWGLTIHPLPLLTATSNGRGGGDYHGSHMDLVGSWAFHLVSAEDTVPDGYTEQVANFWDGR